MQKDDFTHGEIVEYATLLYGEKWRDKLAESLKISRKQLVLTLASGDPVPENITIPFISLVEAHLQEQAQATEKLEGRIHAIQAARHFDKQPKVVRKSAS